MTYAYIFAHFHVLLLQPHFFNDIYSVFPPVAISEWCFTSALEALRKTSPSGRGSVPGLGGPKAQFFLRCLGCPVLI